MHSHFKCLVRGLITQHPLCYHRLEGKKNACPLLDASLMMLWYDMAYVEIHVNQDFKKELKMYYV